MTGKNENIHQWTAAQMEACRKRLKQEQKS
jgi:hypothetical protein